MDMTMTGLVVLAIIVGIGASARAEAPFYADKANLLVYADGEGKLQSVRTVADWEKRRAHILANMQQVMGVLPDAPRRVPLDVQVSKETETATYVKKTITFASENWDRVPAYLLIPRGLSGKTAGVLCLHPTSPFGKGAVTGEGEKTYRNYAVELAERGYVVVAPDYPGFGDYVTARKELYARGYVSCTMKGVWNHMRAVDLLQSLQEVDPERIGCIGHSLGGHNTLFLGVFDPRIKAMVTSCGFDSFLAYKSGDVTGWTHDGYMPRIASVYGKDPARIPFDFPEVLGALAPRAVFICAPLHDDNFQVSSVRECVQAARPIYALYHAENNLVAVYPDAEHDFPHEAREQAYAFLDATLR